MLLLDRRFSSSHFEVVGHHVNNNAGARREQPTNLPPTNPTVATTSFRESRYLLRHGLDSGLRLPVSRMFQRCPPISLLLARSIRRKLHSADT